MGKVRRYFCCTANLTGCKILGGIQLALIGIYLFLTIITLSAMSNRDNDAFSGLSDRQKKIAQGIAYLVLIIDIIFLGLMLLFPIFLIVGAAKRNACLLMTYIILNALSLNYYAAYAVFSSK